MGYARVSSNLAHSVVVLFKLRRETANFMGYARASSNLAHDVSPLAQSVEHRSYEPKVTGSSPVWRIFHPYGVIG